jgi:hypothetical protein
LSAAAGDLCSVEAAVGALGSPSEPSESVRGHGGPMARPSRVASRNPSNLTTHLRPRRPRRPIRRHRDARARRTRAPHRAGTRGADCVLSRKLSVCRHRSAGRTRPFSHRTSSRDPAGEGSLRRDDESYTKIREFINIVQLSRGYILSSSEPSSPLIEEWIRCLRWHDCRSIQGISIGTQNCLLSRSKTWTDITPTMQHPACFELSPGQERMSDTQDGSLQGPLPAAYFRHRFVEL